MKYLGNAFSLQMIDSDIDSYIIDVKNINIEQAKEEVCNAICVVGHQDTMAVINEQLNTEFNANRVSIKLGLDDKLIVAQLIGGRLPEGCSRLPDNFSLKYYIVTIKEK